MNTDETRMTIRRLERAVNRLRTTVWLMWGNPRPAMVTALRFPAGRETATTTETIVTAHPVATVQDVAGLFSANPAGGNNQ